MRSDRSTKIRASRAATALRIAIGLLCLSAPSVAAIATPPASASAVHANPPTPAAPATLAELIAALRARAAASQTSPAVRADYQALLSAQGLSASQMPYADYAYLRLLFEATRDGGYWNLHWTITDREPNSDAIWTQWRALRAIGPGRVSANAECDEISALYAFLARRGGVRNVGLFWPTGNHSVAVWSLPGAPREARIVVPTTQIFLSQHDSFGTRGFDPWKQPRIYEYGRRDVSDDLRLPPELSAFFIAQAARYADASGLSLQRLRGLRDRVLDGAMSREEAVQHAQSQRRRLPAGADRDQLAHAYFIREMREPG
ncbi:MULTISPECIES: hypothetical protein [Lysobacter]|uniref:hypothetical protein n=1 Tax=Lysobacter TaxID=68 RepID=UPI001F253DC6|nr:MULTISPECIES: hypothetical protein [Lysobacter]UJB18184.1 hypothetical protein L1A79_17780 [Lysobacter capsici]UJQ28093.1 hypothetical protein L2D09_22105 [Lysobacter gummosus]